MTKQSAIETARRMADLMETAAFAGPVDGRDIAARKVQWHLTNTGYWGGPAPTIEEARNAAKRAWPRGIPADVARALAI